ncbi:MAG TPA: formate dehydrogenase subunit delta [Noviherbaspirillum sp.]|uniref:formate dehydrogenase subunit delta n=1 Tax=Noviherbaspirillum sp. TaxID=1926288 RepID=UPI002B45DA47|nr:formate dehydrogenase subunit delta [Noviherbaspirillum sp.]HJV85236.1 formate dehydrogenase subunit delta [Noviherbaspirillum sp.]
MDIANLVKMANQIGDYFEAWPDQAEASLEIASHLRRFWAPAMRSELLRHVDENCGEGLKDLVLSSIRQHRDKLEAHA